MEYVRTDEEMSQWHPAFFAGIKIEFCEEENKMKFESERRTF